MGLRHSLLLLAVAGALSAGHSLSADTFHLISPTAAGVTSSPGQSLSTLSTANSGFTPSLAISATPATWYSPILSGAFPAGAWSLLVWSNAPGCASNVTAEIGISSPDGSGYTSLGTQTVDFNVGGNHSNSFSFSLGFQNLNNQRLRVTLSLASGCSATMAYNAGVDFDSRLISTAMGPNGTPTISPTVTTSPTPTNTPIPPLTKSVSAATALTGDTLTYTLNFKNPNSASQASCGDSFEAGSTQWPAGWATPTGGTWGLTPDNGPSAAGTQALDAQITGGFHYTTLDCAAASTDGQLQVDTKILSAGGELSLLWRQSGSSTYQFHVKQGSSANVSLRVITNGGFNEIAVASQAINLSQWYTLKLVVTGFLLQGYINGALVISAFDPNTTYAAGAAGLEIDDAPATGMHAVFDNVQVTQYQLDWYGVTIIDTLPAGLTYVSDSCGGSAVGQVVSLPLGTVTAGTIGSCHILARVAACPATLFNQASFLVALPAMDAASNGVTTTVSCSTLTPTPTRTASPTLTPSPSPSATRTPTQTATPSSTASPSPSATATASPSPTPSATPTSTATATPSPTPSATLTTTPSATASATHSASPTPTVTPTATPTATISSTATPSPTWSGSPTPSASFSPTPSDTASPTPSASPTWSPTLTASPTATASPTTTPTPSITPTASASPSITPTPQPFPESLVVAVYNPAGERVRTLYQGPASRQPSTVSLSQGCLVVGLSSAAVDMDSLPAQGPAQLAWDGFNDQGQAVAPGTYYLKVEAKDPFGEVSAFILPAQVLAAPLALGAALDIYNSAGERVCSLALSPSTGVSALSLLNDRVVPGASPGLLVQATDLGGVVRLLHWDGLGSGGLAVASGVYTLRPRALSGESTLKTLPFTVLDASGEGPSAPVVGPNPAPATAAALRVQAPGGAQPWSADLYDLAGGRVRHAAGAPGATVELPLRGLSAGLYWVQVGTRDALGRQRRWTLKAAVLR